MNPQDEALSVTQELRFAYLHDTVEFEHPQHGKGYFFTPDCIKEMPGRLSHSTPGDAEVRKDDAQKIAQEIADKSVWKQGGVNHERIRQAAYWGALHAFRSLATASGRAQGEVERYQHVKRGTFYTVIGQAELQDTTGAAIDGATLLIYRGDDGHVWARQEDEFHDGRFVPAAPPAQDQGEGR